MVSKSFIFLVKSFLGNFYRHLAIFIWSHCRQDSKLLDLWRKYDDVQDWDLLVTGSQPKMVEKLEEEVWIEN